jgi:hypothetical protein
MQKPDEPINLSWNRNFLPPKLIGKKLYHIDGFDHAATFVARLAIIAILSATRFMADLIRGSLT